MGIDFPSKDEAKWHVWCACEGYDGNRRALQGTYAPGETKSACVSTKSNDHLIIAVRNLNPRDAIDLADHDCTLRLSEIIDKCYFGGEFDVASWFFQ